MTAIDPAAATGVGAQAPYVKRLDDKIAETYQTPRVRDSANRDGVDEFAAPESSARPAEKTGTGAVGGRSETSQFRKAIARGDQAEINFQMSREEREVFLSVMSGRERVSDMSEDEQRLMEKSAARLEKLIEAADARDAASRERIDKAVKEWYLRLSNGKQPPTDLLTLIRESAAGRLD